MSNTIKFYQKAVNAGIKPIIGMEGYIHNGDTLGDKSTKQRFHICLYAKNKKCFQHLACAKRK